MLTEWKMPQGLSSWIYEQKLCQAQGTVPLGLSEPMDNMIDRVLSYLLWTT